LLPLLIQSHEAFLSLPDVPRLCCGRHQPFRTSFVLRTNHAALFALAHTFNIYKRSLRNSVRFAPAARFNKAHGCLAAHCAAHCGISCKHTGGARLLVCRQPVSLDCPCAAAPAIAARLVGVGLYEGVKVKG